MIRILIIFILLALFVYINTKNEYFSNINNNTNNFGDLVIFDDLNNLNNLESTNKTVNYNLGDKPLYNVKDYTSLVWHLRFKNLIKNRYSYDDTKKPNKCEINDGSNFSISNNKTKLHCDLMNGNKLPGNEGTNCHGNNCDESNCHGDNCYESNYAKLKDLPIYLQN